MNTENIKELLNQAKQAATTDEAKALVNDLEGLIDLLHQKDTVSETEEFYQNVKNAQNRFLISLGKAASSLGLGTSMNEDLFKKPEDYSPEQLEKIQEMQRKLEEPVSTGSSMQKLKNHHKVRI